MTSGFESVPTPTQPAVPADEEVEASITPKPNESNTAAFFRVVKKLGRDAAAGRDSLPQLVAAIAEAVENGGLDPKEKFPDAQGALKMSAANYVFDTYTKEDGKKALHDRSKGSVRAQASKIKQVIEASNKPNAYFREALVRAVDMRKGLFENSDDASRKKIKPAFDAYVDMARAQLKKDNALTDEEIEFAQRKKDTTPDADISKELEKAWRVLDKLLTGEGKSGVILPTGDARFDIVDDAHRGLLEAIRLEKPDFNVPKATPEATTNGEEPEEDETNGEQEDEELLQEETSGEEVSPDEALVQQAAQ